MTSPAARLRRMTLAALSLGAACWADLPAPGAQPAGAVPSEAAPGSSAPSAPAPVAVTRSAAPAAAEHPWQVKLPLLSNKEMVSLGRAFGPHFVGLGLQSIAYSNRDGFAVTPTLSHEVRFAHHRLPYTDLSLGATWSGRDGLHGAFASQSLGYEWRLRLVNVFAEVGVATPLGNGFAERFWMPVSAGIGVPF